MSTVTCANCTYFRAKPRTGSQFIEGLCLRYPPQHIARTDNEAHYSENCGNWVWPLVYENRWCGEYKPIEKAAAQG